MVEADIVEHRDLGLEQRNRAIALIDLGHKHIAMPHARAGEWGISRDEILHHPAVHDRRVQPRVS